MSQAITNHKCPACTGPLRFDAESSRLVCDYCGSTYSVEEIKELYAEADKPEENTEAASQETDEASGAEELNENEYYAPWGEDANNLKVYSCPSCGAQMFCDLTTAATCCPYCGNNTVIAGQFTGRYKPELIIPFKLDKDAAIKGLKDYYKNKKFLPNEFTDENHIEEIKGVYVPFWLYDGTASADLTFHASRVSTMTRGNERITTTDHFRVRRAGNVSFSHIPADGSSKAPDEHMDAIEPFDFSQLIPFSTAYLPGFLADIFDVDSAADMERIKKRAENTAVGIMQSDVAGYSTCVPERTNVGYRNRSVRYVLLPVWFLSTRWNNQKYLFAMNGQTGKMIGDLPVSKAKYWKMFALIAAPIAAILSYFLVWGGML